MIIIFFFSKILFFHFLDNIIKPSVIHPTQITRSTLFTQPEMNIHHQNSPSAFKPHISHQTNLVKSPIPTSSNGNHLQRSIISTQNLIHSSGITNGNGLLYKTQQPPPVPNIKRTESVHKPGVHVGITNPNGPSSTNGLLIRQHQQSIPQFHQSMLNLSSIGSADIINPTQPAIGMFGSRVSLQTNSSNFMKHPAYAPQSNKMNGHHQQHHHQPPPNSSSRPPPPTILEDPIIRWIQQVNNSSSINGLTPNGGGNRSQQQQQQQQQQTYPYGSYISTGSGTFK